MHRTPQRTFELFFTPRFPLYFVLGGVLIAVMGDMTSELAKKYFAPHNEPERLALILVASLIGLAGLVALAFSAGAIRRRLVSAGGLTVSNMPQPQRARGLIAFVSLKQREHLEAALKFHGQTLDRVWLLATDEAGDVAEDIKREYELTSRRVSINGLADANNALAARDAVESIYRSELGELSETEVIADFTGGTKPMTVGMIFACLSPSRRLQYVPGRYENGQVKGAFEPVEYVIDYSAIDGAWVSKSIPGQIDES